MDSRRRGAALPLALTPGDLAVSNTPSTRKVSLGLGHTLGMRSGVGLRLPLVLASEPLTSMRSRREVTERPTNLGFPGRIRTHEAARSGGGLWRVRST